ncbi:MAG: ribbon-helix-helix domain-containing protein [Alphaproteobacteria bacterium]|nr:ribbon-helix-helix domain-containing protein [Alphaproteobacteria bacterium]
MQKAKPTINSTLVSRNVTVCGHRTSVRLEPDMWRGLIEICNREKTNQHKVCSMIAEAKPEATSLTAAIRVFIMSYFRAAATEDGHNRAGHGHGMLGNTIENITRAPVASPTAINGTMARVTSTMPYIIGASIKSPPVNR